VKVYKKRKQVQEGLPDEIRVQQCPPDYTFNAENTVA
jgi:hypothetical protein